MTYRPARAPRARPGGSPTPPERSPAGTDRGPRERPRREGREGLLFPGGGRGRWRKFRIRRNNLRDRFRMVSAFPPPGSLTYPTGDGPARRPERGREPSGRDVRPHVPGRTRPPGRHPARQMHRRRGGGVDFAIRESRTAPPTRRPGRTIFSGRRLERGPGDGLARPRRALGAVRPAPHPRPVPGKRGPRVRRNEAGDGFEAPRDVVSPASASTYPTGEFDLPNRGV